jgi:long-subunit acyl-CoA synthetase (AMP-forming)
VVVKDPWTTDNGFLTPTMKIRRNVIESHYASKVPSWFTTRESVIWEDAES